MEKQEKINLIKKIESENEGRFFFVEREDGYLDLYVLGIDDLNIPEGYMIRKYNENYIPNMVELYYGDTFLVSGIDLAEAIAKAKIPKKRAIKFRAKQAGIISLKIAAISIPVMMAAYPLYSAIKTRHNPFKLDETGYHTTMETQIDEYNKETITYSDDLYEEESTLTNGKYLFKESVVAPNKKSIIEKYSKPLINSEGKKVRVVESYDVTYVSVDRIKSYLSTDEKIEANRLFGNPIEQKVVACSDDDLSNSEYYKAVLYKADKAIYQKKSDNIKEAVSILIFSIEGALAGLLLSSFPLYGALSLENEKYINTEFAIKDLKRLKEKLKKLQKQQKLSLKLKEGKHEIF